MENIIKKAQIVLGLGFGDEGKGVVTNYLCDEGTNPLVVRFSGGHQVGHTVEHKNVRHIFSNFGSGTLRDVPTYWSEFCTLNPLGVKKEGDALREMGIFPDLYINMDVMITTPYDVYFNQKEEDTRDYNTIRHGSVGVGFGTTIKRDEEYYKLRARDLLYPSIRDAKLKNIATGYYGVEYLPESDVIKNFINSCEELVNKYEIVSDFQQVARLHNDLIFEGSQGILLDKDYGFFPNVTRSNTVSKNVYELLKQIDYKYLICTNYVTRAYQTRHGNGFMTNESNDMSFLMENPNETNVSNKYQGEFRKGVLDFDLIEFALSCDSRYDRNISRMFVTCLDQVPQRFPMSFSNVVSDVTIEEIKRRFSIKIDNVLGCYSADGDIRII